MQISQKIFFATHCLKTLTFNGLFTVQLSITIIDTLNKMLWLFDYLYAIIIISRYVHTCH